MKFGFEFNKKETPEYSRPDSIDRSDDSIPARPELANQSLEDTFNKENEGKDSRNAFVTPEDVTDENSDWESYGEKASTLPVPDQGRAYESSAEADPGVRERIQAKIKELIEENPENFHDQFIHLIAHLPLSEVDRVLEGIEKDKLVTMTENVVLDNEGNKIDLASQNEDSIEDKDPRTALRKGIKVQGMPKSRTFEESRDGSSRGYNAWKAAPSRLNFKTESDSAEERRNRGLLGELKQSWEFDDPDAQAYEENELGNDLKNFDARQEEKKTKEWIEQKKTLGEFGDYVDHKPEYEEMKSRDNNEDQNNLGQAA